jgi:hypothetical protein
LPHQPPPASRPKPAATKPAAPARAAAPPAPAACDDGHSAKKVTPEDFLAACDGLETPEQAEHAPAIGSATPAERDVPLAKVVSDAQPPKVPPEHAPDRKDPADEDKT